MSEPQSLVGPARDRTARGDIAVHDHVCGIYDDRSQQYEPASRFLKLGLERREQCLYIAENTSRSELLALLQSQGVEVGEAMARGALKVLSGKDMRHSLGGFSPRSMFAFLATAEKEALGAGFTAFRWAADMAWLSQDKIKAAEAVRFESELNSFLLEHRLSALCQYSRQDYEPDFLIAGMETHPLLSYKDIVCDNFYYVPPEEYLKPHASDLRLKRMIGNIVSRERLMQSFLT